MSVYEVGIDWANQASVTIKEIWNMRTGQNERRWIETEDGRVEELKPYPPDVKPYFFWPGVRAEEPSK